MSALILSRVQRAFLIWPSAQDWGLTLLLFILFAALAFFILRITGLFQPRLIGLSPRYIALLVVIAIFTPSLPEELLYRVILLPHPEEVMTQAARYGWAVFSLALYVAAHPLLAWLVWPWSRRYFYRPSFLLIVTLLGAACTLAYLQSGSLWAPVAIHWATIVGWKLFFGGPDFNFSKA